MDLYREIARLPNDHLQLERATANVLFDLCTKSVPAGHSHPVRS